MCCCSTWPFTLSTPPAPMAGLEASRVYCREWDPANSWYRQGSSAAAHLRHGRRRRLRLPRQLVRGRRADELGGLLAHRRRARLAHLGRLRRHPRRDSRRRRARRAVRLERGRSRFLRSIPPTASAGTSASCRTSSPRSEGGPPPETAGADNLKSLAMVFGAVESAETGRPVDIEV